MKMSFGEKCPRFLLLFEEIVPGKSAAVRLDDQRHHFPIVQHRGRDGVAENEKNDYQHRDRRRAEDQQALERGRVPLLVE